MPEWTLGEAQVVQKTFAKFFPDNRVAFYGKNSPCETIAVTDRCYAYNWFIRKADAR